MGQVQRRSIVAYLTDHRFLLFQCEVSKATVAAVGVCRIDGAGE